MATNKERTGTAANDNEVPLLVVGLLASESTLLEDWGGVPVVEGGIGNTALSPVVVGDEGGDA